MRNFKHITAVLLCFVATAGFPTIGDARSISMVTVEWAPHYSSNLPENNLVPALKHPATSPTLNIRKLFRDRLDMAVMNIDLFRYNAKKDFNMGLKTIGDNDKFLRVVS